METVGALDLDLAGKSAMEEGRKKRSRVVS